VAVGLRDPHVRRVRDAARCSEVTSRMLRPFAARTLHTRCTVRSFVPEAVNRQVPVGQPVVVRGGAARRSIGACSGRACPCTSV